jgi:thioredoxin
VCVIILIVIFERKIKMITLVDFYAEWCGPCKAMKPVFAELEEELKGKVEFKKVDVDEQSDEAGKYGVTSIPTFVILKNGAEISRKSGAMPKQVLKDWISANI